MPSVPFWKNTVPSFPETFGHNSPLSSYANRMQNCDTKSLMFFTSCAHPAEDGRLHNMETAVPAVISATVLTIRHLIIILFNMFSYGVIKPSKVFLVVQA